MKLPEMAQVLSYDAPDSLFKRFCIENPDKSEVEAQQIFKDLLGWLWLSVHRSQQQLLTPMIEPLTLLDKMWHVFILHTRDYAQFCMDNFECYLHHEVSVMDEKVLSTSELSAYLSDCYDLLGEAWVLRNFSRLLEN